VICGLALKLTGRALGYNNLVNTTAFWPEQLIGMNDFLLWMSAGALGVFIFQAARLEGKVGVTAATVLLVGVFALCDVHAARFHQGILDDYSKPSALIETVTTNFEPGTCVGFNPEMPPDASLLQQERFQLHLFYLYDYAYRRMHVTDWLQGCDGPLFTYQIDELRGTPAVVLLGQDAESGLYLVAKDRDRGFFVPSGTLSGATALPAGS
jgi:hypothetical protein